MPSAAVTIGALRVSISIVIEYEQVYLLQTTNLEISLINVVLILFD